MDEEIGNLPTYLTSVAEIIKSTEDELDKDGSRFNIFSILGLSSYEVRLHSRLLAELLSPEGTHTFKFCFLELFINNLRRNNKIKNLYVVENFDYTSANVKVEKSIGLINESYTYGGHIDIEITDKNCHRIIIENKIFAGDQKNQLLRYHNYDKDALLLYLTLEECTPSLHSIGTENPLKEDKDYFCISYREFILHWLKGCLLIAKEKPMVKETISQYIHIIEEFTHQSRRHNMSKEIEKLITDNKEFYMSIEEIVKSYYAYKEKIKSQFWKKLEEKNIINTSAKIELNNNAEIRYYIDEDSEGFFYGFQFYKKDQLVDWLDEDFKALVEILKSVSNEFKSNRNYIGWVFSKEFRGFAREHELLFDLNDENEMNKLIDKIINEFHLLVFAIDDRINDSLKGIQSRSK